MCNTKQRGVSEALIVILNTELSRILDGFKEQSKNRDPKFTDLIQDLDSLLHAYKGLDISLKSIDPIYHRLSETQRQEVLEFSEEEQPS